MSCGDRRLGNCTVRSIGYAPTLNDTEDLWVQARRRVQPESVVIVGESRPVFDLDLDELEKGLGKRPVQLALPGSCAYPVFDDLANDESFHGTIICSIVPGMFFAPGGPLLETSEKALARYRKQTPAQRASHRLGMLLEEHVAFLKQEDLTLDTLLKQLPIPNRPNAQVPPRFPPYFQTVDRERRARMIEKCAQPGSELAKRIQQIWLPLLRRLRLRLMCRKKIFFENMGKAIEARFRDTAKSVEKFRARGGKVVFVRFPIQRRTQGAGRPAQSAGARLGTVTKGYQSSRHLLRRLSRARELYLSGVVASFRRRFRRIHQAARPPSSRRATAVKVERPSVGRSHTCGLRA